MVQPASTALIQWPNGINSPLTMHLINGSHGTLARGDTKISKTQSALKEQTICRCLKSPLPSSSVEFVLLLRVTQLTFSREEQPTG